MANRNIAVKIVSSVIVVVLSISCATTNFEDYAFATLTEITIQTIKDNISSGNPFLAIQDISALERRNSKDISFEELDNLYADAKDAISGLFKTAISDRNYESAISIFRSAKVLSIENRFPSWDEIRLKVELAKRYIEKQNIQVGLLIFQKIMDEAGIIGDDFIQFGEVARDGGMLQTFEMIVDAMRRRNFEIPPDFEMEAVRRPQMSDMIDGTVTIWINKGIKLEKGVGYPDRVIGSGFFIDKRGYILTNHHVIESEVNPKYEGYSRLYIRMPHSDKERIPARVVGWDSIFDLALLKVEVEPEFVYTFGKAQIYDPGERIFAIGSPAGLTNTITSGIISAVGRRFLQMGDAMQVDVPINPGNSGGPLVNSNGDLIGIVFAGIEQFEGINFAISANWITGLLPRLFGGGQAVLPWIGVAVDEQTKGLEVTYVLPGEPAERAGISVGDVVTHFNGVVVDEIGDFQTRLLEYAPGTLIRLKWLRDGKESEAILLLGERPEFPTDVALSRDINANLFGYLFGMKVRHTGSILWDETFAIDQIYLGGIADEAGLSNDDPLIVQDWVIDEDNRIAFLQIIVKKRKAAFTERAVQLAAYLEVDSFL